MKNSSILEKRFNRNPEIEAVGVLLQERMPVDFIITKEKKYIFIFLNMSKIQEYQLVLKKLI